MPTFANAESAATIRGKLNNAITRTDFCVVVEDTSQLANLTYSTGSAWTIAEDTIIVAAKEGFSYRAYASGASDFDLQTGAAKLEVLPTPAGHFNFDAILPAGDGTTDDWPKLRRLLDKQGLALPSFYRAGPSIYIPNKRYYMGQDLELKQTVRLFGDQTGYASEVTGVLVFPADSHGIVFNRFNTLNDGTVSSTIGADWSSVEGLVIEGGGGTDRTKHGIYLRSRGAIVGCQVRGFPGDGIHINAAAGAGGSAEGNANLFYISRVTCAGNNGSGFYCNGADANAGYAEMLDCKGNGRHGIYDSSFLGNTYVACHTRGNGNGATSASFVSYGGNRYAAHWLATDAELVATEPGTNSDIWIPDGSGAPVTGVIPLWTAGQPSGTYFVAFSYYADNSNARSVFLGCYAESGAAGSVFLGPNQAVGGSLGVVYEGDWLRANSIGQWTLNSLATAQNGFAFTSTGTVGAYQFSTSSEPGIDYWAMQYVSGNFAMQNRNSSSRRAYYLTNENTNERFKFLFGFQQYLMGSPGSAQYRGIGTAAPTTGTWARGDRVENSAPSAGGWSGWICTTAGTPGTWKGYGAIEA